MKVVPFIAENPAAALAQIHQQLGPEAVVVSVRPLPKQGLARWWPKNHAVEVIACVPEKSGSDSAWECARRASGAAPLREGTQSLLSAQSPIALQALHDGSGRPHVFIGPPGTGKTTLLCKWLTSAVLNENRTAKLWRLDGPGANTAEFLNVYGEMLGVTIDRFWNPLDPGVPLASNPDLQLVDLPGVQPGDAEALGALKTLLASWSSPRIHLVLNAAYETSILTQQFRAFSRFHPEDLSFTHLDEEQRQGKLLDFLVGTNCSLRFLSTGQKIPGDLVIAGLDLRACPEFAS